MNHPPSASRNAGILVAVAVVATAFLFFGAGTAALISNQQSGSEYAGKAGIWMDDYSQTLSRIDDLTEVPQPANISWHQQLEQEMSSLKAIDASIRAYHPSFPWSLNGWHQWLITDVADFYDQFADLYSRGITTGDQVLLDRALKMRTEADHNRLHFMGTLGLKK